MKKGEALFVDDESFALLETPPVAPGAYCPACYDQQVWPALSEYNEQLERAKNVNMFYLSQSKESRFVRRIEKPISVKDCVDRQDAILRLAFIAVRAGKNALVDVDLSSSKIRNGGYQTSSWSGRAIPADIEESALQRRFVGAPN